MRRTGLILCATLACALGAGAAAARADTPPPTETTPTTTAPAPAAIADGVEVGPVAVGGMSLEQATAAVLDAYLAPVELRIGAATVTVSPRRFRVVAPVAAAIARALGVAPGTVVPLRASLDRGRLDAYVAWLAKRYHTEPVDSRLLLRGGRPVVTKPLLGRTIRILPTTMLIRDQVWNGTRTPITVPVAVVRPKLTPAAVGPVIVIRRGENRLILYRGAKLVRTFPVATGQAAYPTPLGSFHIVVMWKNPTWYPPTQDAWAKGLKPVPPGPNNPLGTRWMGLSAPGVGIHGTDEPASIGYSVSHGCIRMQVPQAEWLFDHVVVGTPVFIVPG